MKTYSLLGARVPATASGPPPAAPRPSAAPPRSRFTPLTAKQIKRICTLAGVAYRCELERGNIQILPNLTKSAQLEDWRHEQQAKACGRASLKACTQFHYRELRAHFNNIIGTAAATSRSFRDHMNHGPATDNAAPGDTHEGRELWGHKLQEALKEFADAGITPGLAHFLCKTKYKCKLTDATAYDLERLTYDIIRNGRSKRKKKGNVQRSTSNAQHRTAEENPF